VRARIAKREKTRVCQQLGGSSGEEIRKDRKETNLRGTEFEEEGKGTS